MINDLYINCNTYDKKVIKNNLIFTYICPKCGAKHSFIRHGYYQRNSCFFNNNFEICEKKLTILRLLCKGCLSTHAVLPGNVIPYGIYDNSSILHFLTQHFVYKRSVLSISKKYGISYQLIYEFIAKFTKFLYSLYFVLKVLVGFESEASDVSGMLQEINKFPSDFFSQYFFHTKWIFMMTKFQNISPREIYVGVQFKPPT